MARFSHLATHPSRGFRDILRWRIVDTLTGRRLRDPAGYEYATPVRVNDGSLVASAATPSLTWIGHATFVLRLGGKLIVTDPIWSDAHLGRRPPRRARPASRSRPCRRSTSSSSPTTTATTRPADAPPLGEQDRSTSCRSATRPSCAKPGSTRSSSSTGGRSHEVGGARDHARARAPLVDARSRGIATTRCGAASCSAGPKASPTTRATPRSFDHFAEIGAAHRADRLGDAADRRPTSRAGSWSRSTSNPEDARRGVRARSARATCSRCTGARSGSPTSRSASRRRACARYLAEHGLDPRAAVDPRRRRDAQALTAYRSHP